MARADREQEILDAATEAFGRSGYAHTSVAVIARRADVSKPLVYDYFGSKDGLYLACLDRAGGALVDDVAAAQGGTSMDRVLRTLQAIFDALEPRASDWRLLYDTTLPRDSVVLERAQGYRRQLFRLAAEGTREVLEARGITDADQVALATRLWSSTVTTAVDWWLEQPDLSAHQMVELCTSLFGALTRGPNDEARRTARNDERTHENVSPLSPTS